MTSRTPTLQAHNDYLLTEALLALPGAGLRMYGGMYVDSGAKDRWTAEKTREHYRIAAQAQEVLGAEGTPVAIVLGFDSEGRYYQARDINKVHTAWSIYGNIKTLYLIDWEWWTNHLSYHMALIKKGP